MSTCCTPTRMYSPSPTVKASRVPLYQLGWLGDDGAGDPSLYDIQYGGGTPDYSPNPDFVATLTYPDQGIVDLIPSDLPNQIPYKPVPPAPGQPGSSIAPSVASSISSLFTSIFKPNAAGSQLGPGPAPRVSSSPSGCMNYVQDVPGGPLRCADASSSTSLSAWIQKNFGLLAIGAVGLIVLPGLIGGRRR